MSETQGHAAFDWPSRIWLEKALTAPELKDTHGRVFTLDAPIVRCGLCLRGIRGDGAQLAENCAHNRINGALPCPMSVNHDREEKAI